MKRRMKIKNYIKEEAANKYKFRFELLSIIRKKKICFMCAAVYAAQHNFS
jgi:hypothetical protein